MNATHHMRTCGRFMQREDEIASFASETMAQHFNE